MEGGDEGQDVPTSSEAQDDSLDATLRAAFAEAEKTEESAAEEEAAAVARARDEKGRFAAKEAAQQAQAKPVEQQAQPTEQTQQQQYSPLNPLQSWNAQQREVFAKLPPEAQKIVHERAMQVEQHFTRTAQQLASVQQQYRDIEETIAPYEQKWALNGVPRAAVMKQLLEAQDFINRDPVAAIQWIASTTGVDLGQVGQMQPQVDPQIMTLQQQVEAMRAHIAEQQSYQQQQVLSSANQEIQNFASETAQDGTPLRPYIEQVSQEMASIVALLRSQNPHAPHRTILQEAYDRACWGNPQVRESLIQSQQAAAEAKRTAEERAKAQQAKKAGVSLSGAPNGAGSVDFGDTVESALRAAMQLHS